MMDPTNVRLAIRTLAGIAVLCIVSHLLIEIGTDFSDSALLAIGASAVGAIGGILVTPSANSGGGGGGGGSNEPDTP